MSQSKILFYLCVSFVAGVAVESAIKIPQIYVWAFLLLGIILIVFFSIYKDIFARPPNPRPARMQKYPYICFGFCILLFCLGVVRLQATEFDIANNKLAKLNDLPAQAGKPEKIVLTGVIIDEPDVRENSQNLKVKIDGSVILITTGKYPEYKYLEKIKITGKLESPMENEDFSYKKYLLPQGIYSVMGFPKIELTGREMPNFWQKIYSGILWFKQKMRQSLQKNFSAPGLFVIQGMVLGDRTAIPKDLKQKLSITGVSHIIAVSGTHVVIITAILLSVLLVAGFSRSQAFYILSFLICFYIVLVGMPSSGVRAGIMGIIFLLGQKLGRQNAVLRIIILACALMLLQNPLLLFFDVGFQLSFLAVLALVTLEPAIRYFLKFLIKILFKKELSEKYKKILMMFSATLAAQIFTLPIIVYNFGNISFVSPVANILLLPIAELLMVFGFLSALAGMIFGQLGWLLSAPAHFLLLYFIKVVEFFSQPWAFKTIENVHWIWLFVSYLGLGFLVRYLRKKIAPVF